MAAFLHGILGSGTNWRSFAKRVVDAHPQWGAALVDLRMHGQSQGLPGPHSLESAARDVGALAASLSAPVKGILGHSFGGKVALAYAGSAAQQLTNLWVLDSNPGARPSGEGSDLTLRVVALLKALPPRFAARKDFVQRVLDGGFALPLAQWLSMNLEPSPEGGFRLRLELAAIDALLADYFRVDLFAVLEALPATLRVDLIVGGASAVIDAAALARLEALAKTRPQVHVETLPGAGHWVHVDDPEGVFRCVDQSLRG